jgi:hypothetical protein
MVPRLPNAFPAALIALLLLTAACAPIATTSSPAVTYFIEDGTGVTGFEPGDRELAEWALAAWARASDGRIRFARAPAADRAVIRVRWISPDSGLYGEMERVLVQGKRGAIVNVSPATAGLGEPLAGMTRLDRLLRDSIVYLTCLHELGHALDLGHTANFADIMYAFGYGGDIVEYFSRYRRRLSSRADIAREAGMSPNDIAALQSRLSAGKDTDN